MPATARRAPLAQAVVGAAVNGGTADAHGNFAVQWPDSEKTFQPLRLEAAFTLQDGALERVDLARAAAPGNKDPVRGGSTAFSELAGTLSLAGDRYQLRLLRLPAEGYSATGIAEMSAGKTLSGRLAVEPRGAGSARGALALSGTVGEPVLTPVK